MEKKTKLIIGGAIGGILFLIVLFGCFATVRTGYTGIVVTFGEAQDEILQPGLHVKAPFVTSIKSISNQILELSVDCGAASKDLQTVSSSVTLNYHIPSDKTLSIYKTFSSNFETTVITPAVKECMKAVSSKYTAEELITKRQEVSIAMQDALNNKISKYGFEIDLFNIINFDFSAEFNAAIEAKQTAQQAALEAEQDLQRIKVEAEQTITKAEADAKSTELKAKANANAYKVQAEAEAEAYKLKDKALTPNVLLNDWIAKWNGTLPMVTSDSKYMLDLGSLTAQQSKVAIQESKTEE